MFQANLKKFNGRIDAKLVEWQAALAPFKDAHVVAYHNSWLYFGERFGLKIDLFLEPKPGIPPTPAHLAEVIAKMKTENVRAVIVDPYLNRKTAETAARNTGATVVDVTQFPGGIKVTEGSVFLRPKNGDPEIDAVAGQMIVLDATGHARGPLAIH